jgi:Transposase IS116/IS110/IS902 family
VSALLAEVPGLGVDSAQQILAEVGPTAATFPSAGQLASWVFDLHCRPKAGRRKDLWVEVKGTQGTAHLYDEDVRLHGRVRGSTEMLSLRPEVSAAWHSMDSALQSTMGPPSSSSRCRLDRRRREPRIRRGPRRVAVPGRHERPDREGHHNRRR